MRLSRIAVIVVLAGLLVIMTGRAASGALIIDDFTDPTVGLITVINLLDADPTLIQTPGAGILGAERDLLLDVLGTPGAVSYSGSVGQDVLLFNSISPGTAARLQYDGADADPGPLLNNSEGLGGIDLTPAGTLFYLDFLRVDGGNLQVTGIEIEVHSAVDTATFTGSIADSPTPFRYTADFASFVGGNVFSNVTSAEFRINSPGVVDVDFILDEIGVDIPEPATLALLALGGLALIRSRRK